MDDYQKLIDNSTSIEVTIHSDSKYAVSCMNEWIDKWSNNGWTTSVGGPVANQDMLQDAIKAQYRVSSVSNVIYKWVPRNEVSDADEKCNEVLNNM